MRLASVVIAALVFGSIASPLKAVELLVNGGFSSEPSQLTQMTLIKGMTPFDLTGRRT